MHTKTINKINKPQQVYCVIFWTKNAEQPLGMGREKEEEERFQFLPVSQNQTAMFHKWYRQYMVPTIKVTRNGENHHPSPKIVKCRI